MKSAMMLSVVAVPVAVPVTAEAHAPEAIKLVPSADEPLAIVTVHVAHAMVPVVVIVPPVIGLVVAMLVTPPAPVPHAEPASTTFPAESNFAQLPDVPVPSEDWPFVAVPCRDPDASCVH